MPLPWELPWAEIEHQAVPLAGGLWRGPAPNSETASKELARRGLLLDGFLGDGSAAYRTGSWIEHEGLATDFDFKDPASRAAWIALRIATAVEAMAQPVEPPRMMGILNLTADSFSDGGCIGARGLDETYWAQCLISEQADVLDLGAESTRPGAEPVSAAEQLEHLLPAIERLKPLGHPISVDTRSAEVASACLDAGAEMINDVSGLADPEMIPLLARQGKCTIFAMHMRGTPADMQQHCQYGHLIGEIADEMMAIVLRACEGGIQPQRLVLDPGIGFAKSAEQCREIIHEFHAFRALGLPLLAGPSRKSFMSEQLPHHPAHRRDGGTAGAAALCAAKGASWLRLHRGGMVWEAVKVAAACSRSTPSLESVPR